MPRVSRQQAELNRQKIEQTSSSLFREQGFNGVSVADLMAAVGLTHGGFYANFASKDELVAIASEKAFEQAYARGEQRVASKSPQEAMQLMIDAYLSERSRQDVGSSCPIATLAADVAREAPDKPVRKVYVDGLEKYLTLFYGLQNTGDPAQDQRQSLQQVSMLVGALLIARATNGGALSDAVIDAVRASEIFKV